MKTKILLVLIALVGTSCATLNKIEPEENFYGIDFRRFADKDFLFSTEKYTGDHLLLGMVSMEIYAGGEYTTEDSGKNLTSSSSSSVSKWVFDPVSMDHALDEIYNKAIEYKGNAFVELKIENITKVVTSSMGKKFSNPATVPGIRITGNIIKRTK